MADKYYEKHKDRLWKEVWKTYQNLSEEQKQKLFEYIRNPHLTHKK